MRLSFFGFGLRLQGEKRIAYRVNVGIKDKNNNIGGWYGDFQVFEGE